MKRFVDLRQADIGHRFAFWDTVRDEFDELSGSMAWDAWEDFVADCYPRDELDRYRRLCPEWVFVVTKEEPE